jgi:hypothetical protein
MPLQRSPMSIPELVGQTLQVQMPLATRLNACCHLTSAKSGQGIDSLFHHLGQLMLA